MSSLQKFHRRTNNVPSGPVTWPATAIGMGDDAHGYWLGDVSSNKLIVAPKSTEFKRMWGGYGFAVGTTSAANGLANTNTLAAYGSTTFPAAYGAKNITTGGYNTWYLPAINELVAIMTSRNATPFYTNNAFNTGWYYVSSTEYNSKSIYGVAGSGGTAKVDTKDHDNDYRTVIRAVRRTAI